MEHAFSFEPNGDREFYQDRNARNPPRNEPVSWLGRGGTGWPARFFDWQPAAGGSGAMMRWLGRWLLRVLVAFAAVSLAAFVVDWTVYKLRGSPHSTVVVSRFMVVPLKGEKTEYDYLGTANLSCAVALFPQGGQDPCWHLRRNPNQWENVGTPAY